MKKKIMMTATILSISLSSFAYETKCSNAVSKLANAIVLATNTELSEKSSRTDTSVILDYSNAAETILGYRVTKGWMNYTIEVESETCAMSSITRRSNAGSVGQ